MLCLTVLLRLLCDTAFVFVLRVLLLATILLVAIILLLAIILLVAVILPPTVPVISLARFCRTVGSRRRAVIRLAG